MASRKTRSQPTAAGRRFRRHQLNLAEGGKLVLHGDGSITQTDAAYSGHASYRGMAVHDLVGYRMLRP